MLRPLVALLLCVFPSSALAAKPAEPDVIDASQVARPIQDPSWFASGSGGTPPTALPSILSSAYPYFATLQEYTFEPLGYPDTQGWTAHDLTAQDGVFWHVDDFAGLPIEYHAIAGLKSMWCGVRPGQIINPAYGAAPGYGNTWTQYLESLELGWIPSNDAKLAFRVSYDFWNSLDRLFVEYRSGAGAWNHLATFTGTDMSGSLHEYNIAGGNLGGTLQFRFVVVTNPALSDEDGFNTYGAVIVDEIYVTNTTTANLVLVSTFESEPVGSTTTSYWTGTIPAPFGTYGGLVTGTSVVQSGTPNTTAMWSFFSGSTETYACGGFPGQTAVPKTDTPGSLQIADYLVNEVRSPYIYLDWDKNGQPVDPAFDSVTAEFDAYLDLPLAGGVVMSFRHRFLVGGLPTPWNVRAGGYYSDTPVWMHISPADFGGFVIPAGATHVQIGIIAGDTAYQTGATGQCHTHAPLIDNVVVHRLYRPYFVTNTNNSGSGSLRQAILSANGDADRNAILFDVTGDGPHVIQPASPLPQIAHPVWIDGFSQAGSTPNLYPFPGSSAVLKVELDGSLLAGSGNGLHFGSGGYGVARGLVIGGFPEAGIRSETSSLMLNGCYIGTDIWGTTANPNHVGIMVSNSASDIGGVFAQERMVIAANTTDGLVIEDDPGFPSYITHVFGTYIGVAADASPMGNGQHGVHVLSGVGAQIGEPSYAPCVTGYTDRNWIAHNQGDGVRVENAAMNVMISNNRIHGNAGMGIDLGGDGYTPPDAGDIDTGANGLQNRPELTGATGTTVTGYLNTEPNTVYRVEFFMNSNCISGGEEYIGYQEVTTDNNGQVPIWFTCASIPPASTIQATVTTWVGGTNTSEFSDCVYSNNTIPGSPLVTLYDTSSILRASVVYDNIVSAGNTFLAPVAPPEPVPGNFDLGPTPLYWDITTTATYDGAIHVSLHYDPNTVPGPENMLRLLHHDGSTWVDITDDVDIANHRIGGTTNGLSPFVLAVPSGATGVDDNPAPSSFALHANIPNPFNPVTAITYDVPAGGAQVEIAVFDVAGRRVRTLVNELRGAGSHHTKWNGDDENGARAASGVYFYRMRAGTFVETRKMVLLK